MGGRGNRQNRADWLDTVRIPMRVDEADHHFDRWASSPSQNTLMPCAISHSPSAARGFALQHLHLLGHIGRDAVRLLLSTSTFLPHSFRVQPIFSSDRHDRLPARAMLPLVVEDQPHRTFTYFRGKLVHRLTYDAPAYSEVGASGKSGANQLCHAGKINGP